MNIGLYFGSFNPIHHGHLIIANHMLNNAGLEQVWFIVSPQNPLKPAAGLLNEYHRLFLVQLSVENEPGLKASDIEFRLPKPSYTVDTLAYLQEKISATPVFGYHGQRQLSKFIALEKLRAYPATLSHLCVQAPGV